MRVNRLFAQRWYYLLAFTPFLTDWIERGRLPMTPREYVTEVVVGLLVAAGVAVIHRDAVRLRALAETDSLTRLYNRHRFTEDIEQRIALARRTDARLSVVFMDVDGFKQVNDRYGHAQGDLLLSAVARGIQACARRRVDRAYRLGGDEFALLLFGVGAEGAEMLVRPVLGATWPQEPLVHELGATMSVGIAELGPDDDAGSLLRRADAAMYRTKPAHWRCQDGPAVTSTQTRIRALTGASRHATGNRSSTDIRTNTYGS
jgi:diguanylate cyclase (GGDEF)-like protein